MDRVYYILTIEFYENLPKNKRDEIVRVSLDELKWHSVMINEKFMNILCEDHESLFYYDLWFDSVPHCGQRMKRTRTGDLRYLNREVHKNLLHILKCSY